MHNVMTGHFLEIGLLSWLSVSDDTFAQCILKDFEFGGGSIEFRRVGVNISIR